MTTSAGACIPQHTKEKTELWFNNPHHAYAVNHNNPPARTRKNSTTQKPQPADSEQAQPTQPPTVAQPPMKQGTPVTQDKKPAEARVKEEKLDLSPSLSGPALLATQPPEKVAASVSCLFSKMLDHFGCSPGDSSDPPDGAVLALMGAFLTSQQEGKRTKEVLKSLGTTFQAFKANSLFKEFVQVLMSYDVDKKYLLDNGVQEAAFSTEDNDEDSLDDEEDLEDDDEWSGDSLTSKKRKRGSKKDPNKKKSRSGGKKGESKGSKRRRLRRSPDKWTPEEDEKLIELVNKYGVNTKKWRAIAEELGTSKNSAKCAQHWRRVLAPNIHKGSWTEDEEEKLLEGVKVYGLTQWTNIAREIPGRTDIQCRYHYIRQKNSREQEWNDEEDDLVRKLVDGYGSDKVNWLELSETLAASKIRRTPRTALECKQRYELVNKKSEK